MILSNTFQGNPDGQGINYYGVTLFDEQSSKSSKGIFTSWRDLFENALNIFEIKGNFIYGDNEQDGVYERININRDEVVNQLRRIISMSEQKAIVIFTIWAYKMIYNTIQ
ncbi:hypothetical protein [Psychrobacillus sp. NPDC096623]|uniref:hypothetical protein n=1 Tax=Psychrobacillus sp. NPDC096623 TaxID=3364492 RepID=UPI00382554E9